MMTINENKKLSKNKKRRVERKVKIDDELKSLSNKSESEKKKKNKNLDKIKELVIELVKIKYVNDPIKLQSELKELNKIHVIDKNLHEIKQKIFMDYVGELEMVGNSKVGDQIRQTHIRFRNFDNYDPSIKAIVDGYDAEGAIFNGYIFNRNTPLFNKVERSRFGNGCDFKHEIIEYRGYNCFIPTKGYCFVKYVNFLTGKDYRQQYLHFIRNEKRRSNIMTKARIRPFCKAKKIIWDFMIVQES